MALELDTSPDADSSLGVFETLLIAGGRAHELDRHLARLGDSTRALYEEPLPDSLAAEVAAAASGNARARMRVDLVPGWPPSIAVSSFDAVLPEQAVAIEPVVVTAGFGAHKLSDRAWLQQAEALVGGEEGARPLLVTRSGALLESTRANVFLERDGVLTTPSLDGSILPGVTRSIVFVLARRLGISLRELPLTLEDLEAADAVLLTSSLRLIERSAVTPAGERLREALAAEIA